MDKNNRLPLYLQLMEDLIKKIDESYYPEGERLPPERELCEIYKLSRITVRQALQELEREGYIYKVRGAGTFVSAKRYNQHLVKLYSFTEEMKKNGKEPSTVVLDFEEAVVDERLASKLNISPFEIVIKVIRLQLADDEPLLYETTYLPKKFFPNLSKEDLESRSMYQIFIEDYSLGVTKAIESFKATTLREEEAKHFQLPSNQSAMMIKRYAYHNEYLIGYTLGIARGDKFDYTVELT